MEKKKDGFESFLKFTALGLARLAVSMATVFKDDLIDTYDKNKMFSDVVVSLRGEIRNGVGSFNNKVIEIKTGVEYQNKKNVWGSFASTDEIDDGLCTLMLTAGGNVDNMVKVSHFPGSTIEETKTINSMIQERSDIAKVIELTGLHEAYHCDEEVSKKRFNIPDRNELNDALNSLYSVKFSI